METIENSDEEFRIEIDYQLELVSELNAANSQNISLAQNNQPDLMMELVSKLNAANLADINNNDNNQADLFNLEQSLIKMTQNETFLENFKSNEVALIYLF